MATLIIYQTITLVHGILMPSSRHAEGVKYTKRPRASRTASPLKLDVSSLDSLPQLSPQSMVFVKVAHVRGGGEDGCASSMQNPPSRQVTALRPRLPSDESLFVTLSINISEIVVQKRRSDIFTRLWFLRPSSTRLPNELFSTFESIMNLIERQHHCSQSRA